jgi:hypothetical protein
MREWGLDLYTYLYLKGFGETLAGNPRVMQISWVMQMVSLGNDKTVLETLWGKVQLSIQRLY